MDKDNPAILRARINHYRQMMRMVEDPALCDALDAMIRDIQEKLTSLAKSSPAARRSVIAAESPATLGDVLYANCKAVVPEQDWVSLVKSIAAGDQVPLHRLYERAHLIVFTFCLRNSVSLESAEELTINVFRDVWRCASHYDPANSTVVGWIMNQARSRALDRGRAASSDRIISSPAGVTCPTASLQALLAYRIAEQAGEQPVLPPSPRWSEPEWAEVAAGIECKLLATDTERHRVSMLVRLAPGASYPAHAHAGTEELYLLEGELWIDQRKLFPGDYNYGAPGTGDERVWSEMGCACVLVTSINDRLC